MIKLDDNIFNKVRWDNDIQEENIITEINYNEDGSKKSISYINNNKFISEYDKYGYPTRFEQPFYALTYENIYENERLSEQNIQSNDNLNIQNKYDDEGRLIENKNSVVGDSIYEYTDKSITIDYLEKNKKHLDVKGQSKYYNIGDDTQLQISTEDSFSDYNFELINKNKDNTITKYSGVCNSLNKTTYDELGRPIRKTSYAPISDTVVSYSNDSKDPDLIQTINYDSETFITSKFAYEYDNENRKIKETIETKEEDSKNVPDDWYNCIK